MSSVPGLLDPKHRSVLSQKVLEIVKNGGKYNQNEQTDVSGESLDLSSTGREFVSEALATKLLKPLLDPGAPSIQNQHQIYFQMRSRCLKSARGLQVRRLSL